MLCPLPLRNSVNFIRITFVATLMWVVPSARAETGEGGVLDRLASFFSGDLKTLDDELTQLKPLLNLPPVPSQQTTALGFSTKQDHNKYSFTVSIDLGRVMKIDGVVLVPLNLPFYGWPGPGYGFPRRYRVDVSMNPTFDPVSSIPPGPNTPPGEQRQELTVIAAAEAADIPNPGLNPVVFDTSNQNVYGQYVGVTVTVPWTRTDKMGLAVGPKLFALGELMVLSGKRNVAAGLEPKAVSCLDSLEEPGYSKAYLVDGQSILGPPVIGDAGMNGFQTEPADTREPWVQVDLQHEVEIQEVRLLPAWTADNPEIRGYGFPKRFKVEVADTATAPVWKVMGKISMANAPNENPVSVRGKAIRGRYVRIVAEEMAQVGKSRVFALGEMEVYTENENFALGKEVTASTSLERGGWGKRFLVDGATSQGKLIPWPEWFAEQEKREEARKKRDDLLLKREETAGNMVGRIIKAAGYLVGGLVALFVYLTFRSLLKKRRALEALRTRIARDIHDEIGSGLGTISLLSRMAQDESLENARADLAEINRTARGMAEALRDIIWFNRTDVDTVRDLLMRMRETAEAMMSKQQYLNFQTIGESLVRPISAEVRREIFLIFKEALHNILKHAEARKVDILAGLEGNEFTLNIRDDGKGFDKGTESLGIGMDSMRQRAATLHGALQLETKPGRGTALSLRARLK